MATGAVYRVQPHVGLEKAAEIRKRQCGAKFGSAHDERDETNICHAIDEDIGAGPGRVHGLHALGPHRPMHESQLAPALIESDRTRQGRRSDGKPGQSITPTRSGG